MVFSVSFGHLFRLLFEYTEDYFNQLRVIAFDSYQEYTIATDTAISARGTQKSIACGDAFLRALGTIMIEGADPLKLPWVELAPSEMPYV